MSVALDIIETTIATAGLTDRLPSATIENLSTIGQVLTSDKVVYNEFITTLVDNTIPRWITAKRFSSPLSFVKGNYTPMGNKGVEYYINPAKAKVYSMDGSGLLSVDKPSIKMLVYQINRENHYDVDISRPLIARAFSSEQMFMSFLDSIVNSLYSGSEIDEFELTKNLMAKGVADSQIITDNNYAKPIDANTSELFLKAIKTTVGYMQYPSTELNGYSIDKTVEEDKVTTWCNPEDLLCILREDVYQNMNISYLASVFNLSLVDFTKNNLVRVNNFGSGHTIMGGVCDKAMFRIQDNFKELDSFYDTANAKTKYTLHVMQTFGLNLFANAVFFTEKPATPAA